MIGIKATSKNAFCVTNNGSMKSENTPRNKFRTPFTDPRCPSEHVSYPICRLKMPLGICSVPYLQTQDASRNKFRTPFAESKHPSELVTTNARATYLLYPTTIITHIERQNTPTEL